MSTTQKNTRYLMTSNPQNGVRPQSLSGLVGNFKKNFLEKEIEIVPGLTHNQYEVVKSIYFCQHNTFQSGPTDENGNPKHYYDLITDRNDQATKNINVDTKDAYIKSETEGSYLKTWMLRREFMGYAKTSGFGRKLNEMADDLPDFGTVVWKKVKEKGRTDVSQVELINLMNDPSVKNLKDGMVVERHNLTQYDLFKRKSWDQKAVENLVVSGRGTARVGFLDQNNAATQYKANQVDETTPFYETYELWGEIPRDMYEKYKTGGLPRVDTVSQHASEFYKAGQSSYGVRTSPHFKDDVTVPGQTPPTGGATVVGSTFLSTNETVYVMAVVAGIEEGSTEAVLFCKEVSRDLFPYKEVHYRRRKGRWLGLGNYELCFPLIEKANELTNRFFSSLRIALLHLYQTRDKLHVKNFLEDLVDGDLTVSKSEITAIPTEIRGFTQYKEEIDRIESKADRLCNSFEVVTGENLPAGTPWKLGNQQLQSATKLFEYVQENMGLFIEDVFNEWLLPDFAKSLKPEHILELMDDVDDIEIYYNAKRKLFQYQVLKQYIIDHEDFPSIEELTLVGSLVKDQIKKGPKQLQLEMDYYGNLKYTVKMVMTDENDAKKENTETLTTLFQTTAANPAALQDPRLMKILNMILEQSGYSPLEVNAVNETETNPLLNPAFQGGGGAERSIPGQQNGSAPPIPERVPAGA